MNSRSILLAAAASLLLPPAARAAEGDAVEKQLVAEVENLRGLTQQMVDQIFSFSELGFQEHETSRYVTGILEKHGFRIERGVAGIPTAWVATWGTGKPVIGFIADLDCLPAQSQKPGVAYRAAIVEGAPGHGEGHNAGQAVNVAAALALQKIMRERHLAGTLKLYPGVAEELLATKAFFVRAGLLEGVDVMLGAHVDNTFGTAWGARNIGLVSIQYFFHGRSAHAASFPWKGRSALDAVELMNIGWNYRREHLPLEQRSHYVIINGGEQPNVVPAEAGVWYFFRQTDDRGIRELHGIGDAIAQGAAMMTETTVDQRTVGSAWPTHFNKPVAEIQQRAIEAVGMPVWSEADQTLARALQKEIGAKVEGLATKVKPLDVPTTEGGTDDIGDISWKVPTVYLRFPANIPQLPGHNWANGVAMATPIAHKGSTAGAKAQALTALRLLTSPGSVKEAWAYFATQTRTVHYAPLLAPSDRPAITFNRDKMERFVPQLRRVYYDPRRFKSYLEQLGIKYPTVRDLAGKATAATP
jgi:aminobenzoyl-glutamate utilization protein B